MKTLQWVSPLYKPLKVSNLEGLDKLVREKPWPRCIIACCQIPRIIAYVLGDFTANITNF